MTRRGVFWTLLGALRTFDTRFENRQFPRPAPTPLRSDWFPVCAKKCTHGHKETPAQTIHCSTNGQTKNIRRAHSSTQEYVRAHRSMQEHRSAQERILQPEGAVQPCSRRGPGNRALQPLQGRECSLHAHMFALFTEACTEDSLVPHG